MTKINLASHLIVIIVLILTVYSTPIGFTQITKIKSWWPEQSIAKSIGVPGYASTEYNYFSLGTWTCTTGIGPMANIYAKPLSTFGSNFLGNTDAAIRSQLKKKYQDAGSKVILSVFGDSEYPVRFGKNAQDCATKLANDVINYQFDGVQINYQDTYTLEQGTAQSWLINFTSKLRSLLPSQKIIYTVEAAYFRAQNYPNQGFVKINKQVGSKIDFYNIKYFESVGNLYDDYNQLFISSSSPNTKTSVKQINQAGVPLEKIVIGKTSNQNANGYISPETLGNWAISAKNQIGWKTGFWLGSFSDDDDGANIHNALKLLKYSDDGKNNTQPDDKNNTQPDNKNNTQPDNKNNTQPDNKNNTQPDNNNQTNNNSDVIPTGGYTMPFPIYLAYADGVSTWWGDDFIAGLGVPGYAPKNPYNYFALSFWLSSGPVDLALVWAQAGKYFSWVSNDTQQIQKKLKKAYNDAGKRVMVSAFGATQFPTTQGRQPIKTANDLADFVLANNLDGVDIDWEDNGAMEAGTG